MSALQQRACVRVDRVLIVRTSSMGDLIHTLPAVSDLARHHPACRIDWVAEDAFAEIPAWHPAVTRVIPVALRRWRKQWWQPATWRAWRRYRAELRQDDYDLVIDLQGLIKSAALVAWQARGPRHGLDRHSAREPLASVFYHHRHAVARMQPAVLRYRRLLGLALGYEPEGEADFALRQLQEPAADAVLDDGQVWSPGAAVGQYVAVMPSASRDRKLWPEADWQVVLHQILTAGCLPLLLAGNVAERERAQRLVAAVPRARILPRLSLQETARVLAGARAMIGLDSGLTHLAAALGRPTVGVYGATPVVRTPISGPGFCRSLGDHDRRPSLSEVSAALTDALAAGQSQPPTWCPGAALSESNRARS